MAPIREQLRIAALINTSPSSPIEPFVRASWKKALNEVAPSAHVDFFDPVIAQEFPEPEDYDLVALSGGTTDPRSSEPWVLKMMDFIRDVVASPSTKLLGICWGHQAIAQALGGKIETMKSGPVGNISTIQLTAEGQAFLGCPNHKRSFVAPEFHVRWVSEAPRGMIPLAENHQAYLAQAGNIFTFQTHPEMDVATVQAIVKNTSIYTSGRDEAEIVAMTKRAEKGHDGLKILQRIVDWISYEG